MRLLIATDGSPCAEEAQIDLQRAGLPKKLDVIVYSAADVFLPADDRESNLPKEWIEAARRAGKRGEQALQTAQSIAQRTAERLRAEFPTWTIRAEAAADSPGWGVITFAEKWKADLIVVGSQGYSALGRFILGSVSQTVLAHAHCPVRIGRRAPDPDRGAVRIVAGVDGSQEAKEAVSQISQREWPSGSEVRLIGVIDPRISTAAISYLATLVDATPQGSVDEESWIQNIIDKESEKLLTSGLAISTSIQRGDPKRILVDDAEAWSADCIFLGARGLTRVERFLLGSVSGAVAARAHCSVEVIRS